MLESHAFTTRARTVDHLGRGQIADCPTAISELWKNSYDAYATQVSLDIFDGEEPVAALCDDGHGMSQKEFVDKWLVVGTESKITSSSTPMEDRNGLPFRPRQGQKGIGRLSSGYLGPLLLFLSKRKGHPFVAALIDWRVFGNPYLLLHDVEIPVATFEEKCEFSATLDLLGTQLIDNVWGNGDDPRSKRIKEAWSKLREDQSNSGDLFPEQSTQNAIERLLVNSPFTERHFSRWGVWNGRVDSGTALFVADIDFDLRAQLQDPTTNSTVRRARKRFFEILSSFADPFPSTPDSPANRNLKFDCTVKSWFGEECRTIIGKSLEFDISKVQDLEHVVEGSVDDNGTFTGRIKAFGRWLDGVIELPLKEGFELPRRANTKVGPFKLFIATAENELKNTSMTEEQHALYRSMAEIYSGFMLYRDGLRVMPYGHPSNDLFEIEQRRSLHAGREFWNLRNMFGRIAITGHYNPNLKDKAGREGLIDNTAAKGLKDIVQSILMTLAREYFGSDSDDRSKIIKENQRRYKSKKEQEQREKEERQRKKLEIRLRKKFRHDLKSYLPAIDRLNQDIEVIRFELSESRSILNAKMVLNLRQKVLKVKDALNSHKLQEPPGEMGSLESDFFQYRTGYQRACSGIEELLGDSDAILETIEQTDPAETVRLELDRAASVIRGRLRGWQSDAEKLLLSEARRLRDWVNDRSKILFDQNLPLVEEVRHGRTSLVAALRLIQVEKERLDEENEEVFLPYVAALESLHESIDLASLAAFGTSAVTELQNEVERLNALAQLGITTEIIGHELEGFDSTIQEGLRELPALIKETNAYHRIKVGHDGLTDRIRFLSPLKLSGNAEKEWLSGALIFEYIQDFFKKSIATNGIEFTASPGFLELRIFETRARIFPVFINLVNNSRYWVSQRPQGERKIRIDCVKGKVIVGDSGVGVDERDLRHLFRLFFTRRAVGGRGVGLYLCRANLAAGGHRIYYALDDSEKILPGANFVIEFSSLQSSLI